MTPTSAEFGLPLRTVEHVARDVTGRPGITLTENDARFATGLVREARAEVGALLDEARRRCAGGFNGRTYADAALALLKRLSEVALLIRKAEEVFASQQDALGAAGFAAALTEFRLMVQDITRLD